MSRLLVAACALGLVLGSCSSRPRRPPGPPPEYERPRLAPWDAGKTANPFENLDEVIVERVTEEDAGAAGGGGTTGAAGRGPAAGAGAPAGGAGGGG